jgi:hypothetical protein
MAKIEIDYWDYRLGQFKIEGIDSDELSTVRFVEVYFDKDDKPLFWSDVEIEEKNVEELKEFYNELAVAFRYPVIILDDIEPFAITSMSDFVDEDELEEYYAEEVEEQESIKKLKANKNEK